VLLGKGGRDTKWQSKQKVCICSERIQKNLFRTKSMPASTKNSVFINPENEKGRKQKNRKPEDKTDAKQRRPKKNHESTSGTCKICSFSFCSFITTILFLLEMHKKSRFRNAKKKVQK
jgi:predicted Fe-S protein YdhL (DUF1289 family)